MILLQRAIEFAAKLQPGRLGLGILKTRGGLTAQTS